MNNLPEIKDIHIPDTVSMFPLAYGWWVILVLIIGLFLFIQLVRFIIRTSKRYYALKELKNLDLLVGIDAVIGLSNLLRRICSIKYKNASSLYGKDWVNFLTSEGRCLSADAANLLINAPFMNRKTKKYNQKTIDELKTFGRKWIGDNL